MDFISILKALAEYGVLVVIAGMVLYFGYRYFDVILDEKKVKIEKDLSTHNLFSYLRSRMKMNIPNVGMEDPYRKKIAVTFLTIKFHVFHKHLKKLTKLNYKEMDGNDVFNVNMDALINATDEYEKICQRIGMPEIFVNKFAERHNKHVDIVKYGAENISKSSFYVYMTTKQSAIFDIYKMGFHLTLVDAEKTLEELNGKLTARIKENEEKIDGWDLNSILDYSS